MVDANIHWGQEYILIAAKMVSPFKVGFPNPRGWLAYWLDSTLFVKRADYDVQAEYYDFGSSSECYCNSRFLELETFAPIGKLAPGESAMYTEIWELYRDVDFPKDENTVHEIVEKLGLE